MTHLESMIMYEVKTLLEVLENRGIGYLDLERSNVFHYNIDGHTIRIGVDDITTDVD